MNHPFVDIAHVTKRFGDTLALDDVSLQVREGERVALLGPSGCGKTTLLRVLAGLESPDRGRVAIDGETLVGDGVSIPAERRRVGMVFQDWALFPHLTVAKNVAYGLTRDEVAAGRVTESLAMVGLENLADRHPHELSGGQAQRVALARSLAPRPRVLLFDEPFSNLDTELRARVRADVADLMRAVGMTSIFVTHDQEESFVLGDRVAVMREGAIAQVGTPAELYETPASPWVARFVGDANLVDGTGLGADVETAIGTIPTATPIQGECQVLVRPEHLRLAGGDDATIEDVEFYGHDTSYSVSLGGRRLLVRELTTPRFAVGDRVSLRHDGPDAVAFPGEGAVEAPAAVG